MRKGLLIIFLIGLVACQKSEYSGYSLSRTGLDYKIIGLGDPNQTIKDSDVVDIHIRVFSLSDSSLFNGNVSKLYAPKLDTGLQEFLGMLAVGDSASVYLNSSKLRDLVVDVSPQEVRVEIRVDSKSKYTSWLFYQKYPELSRDLEIEEQVVLLRLLKEYETDSIEVVKGMFIIRKVIGEGKPIKSKDEINVHYTIRTADGRVLDSTYEPNQPFIFLVGQQGQVIEGFDIGIRKMRNGGKATFVIPSKLAFGRNGSSTGIAKGYETLIYEVEVVGVQSSVLK